MPGVTACPRICKAYGSADMDLLEVAGCRPTSKFLGGVCAEVPHV